MLTTDVFPGRDVEYVAFVCENARILEVAIRNIQLQAYRKGADAIIGLTFSIVTNQSVAAAGTAVKFKD
ncbi:heavy metal-binding domain-containing protein [Paenibacillus sp. FSL H7-0331]|uniref:heavy metal-binding domain-containing protein n=1 Tax=Paenibacillus sp. FSL H7-0331 TaxID=1920421 RepID=UPI0035580C90